MRGLASATAFGTCCLFFHYSYRRCREGLLPSLACHWQGMVPAPRESNTPTSFMHLISLHLLSLPYKLALYYPQLTKSKPYGTLWGLKDLYHTATEH